VEPREGSAQSRPELVAFSPEKSFGVKVVPAPRRRGWIDSMRDRWANRCLPLVVANESGWMLLNSHAFEAVWSGDPEPRSVTIRFEEDVPGPHPVQSHFGDGILTWPVPYLFRTPRGFNLLARGPSNWPKDGICALEGLVETDWSVATFTMNWKFTRPDHAVRFDVDEPFCMIVPQRRGELETFRPVFRDFASDPQVKAATKAWLESRHEAQVRKFLAGYSREWESERTAWEGHYFRGTAPDGTEAPEHEHQKHLRLSEFERDR
jgi:Family of unknown function (DUF6065)